MLTISAYHTRKPSLPQRLRTPCRHSPAAHSSRPPRRRRFAVLAATLVALASATMPGLATAQSLNDVSIATGASYGWLVLDVAYASTTARAPVNQWYGNFGANQRWNFVQLPDGHEHIVNLNSGMCLTTDGVPGDQVYQWPCNNGWQDEWSGSLTRQFNAPNQPLKNPASGLYLDVTHDFGFAGAQIITWYWNNTIGEYFGYYQN